MGIVDIVSQEIIDSWGEDALRLLQIYEAVYPPDLAITTENGTSLFDFDIYGGDISVAGFYNNTTTFESIIHLATQDLLFRISTSPSSSVLFPTAGNANIAQMPRDAIKGAISMAVADSPFISKLRNVTVRDLNTDEIQIDINAITPTGDGIAVGFKING